MAKGKKKKAAPKKPEQREHDHEVEAVSELVTVLACPKSVIDQLGLSCEDVLEQIDVACGFARFASSAWANRQGEYREIDPIARALVEEYQRHADRLVEILDRLAPIASSDEGDEDDHEDLDPKDVFQRIEPMLVAPADA